MDILEQIRKDRNEKSVPLGILIKDYGADKVVEALGVLAIAHILGLDEFIDEYDTYEEEWIKDGY